MTEIPSGEELPATLIPRSAIASTPLHVKHDRGSHAKRGTEAELDSEIQKVSDVSPALCPAEDTAGVEDRKWKVAAVCRCTDLRLSNHT